MKIVKLDLPVTPDHAVVWQNQALYLLDQRALPATEQFVELKTAEETAVAIREMVVRGAPAIGVTAAYGVVLAARMAFAKNQANWKTVIEPAIKTLMQARPTAVNLEWAIGQMQQVIRGLADGDPEIELLKAAKRLHQDDIDACKSMGEYGASLIETNSGIITHCNAGALATGGYGTALGVIRSAHASGKLNRVYADETRPWLQGSRLTAWELSREGIPVTLLADGAAASRMAQGGIDWVVVGSDRIAGNGDVANKIGTYHLILAARHHGVKVMVAAPTSTVDMNLESGQQIPIEQRNPQELLGCAGNTVAAAGVEAWNPVFDVTPAALIDVIVTERGIIHRPTAEKMKKHLS